MIAAVHAEWTKLRTQRGTLIGLAVLAVLMVAATAWAASEQHTDAQFGGDDDLVQLGLAGILFAQIAAAVVGGSLMTTEWSSRMIRTTLVATQSRFRMLLAKAIVLAVAVFPVALTSCVGAFVVAQHLLRQNGYRPPAYPHVSLGDAPALRAVVGTALLLTLYALLALGIATVLRHSGATIATSVALLFFPFILVGMLPDHLATRVKQIAPIAGMSIQDTTGRMLVMFGGSSQSRVELRPDGTEHIIRPPLPIGHWQGLGVAAAWAVGALVIGWVLLRQRDA